MTALEAEEIAHRARAWAKSTSDFELRLILTEAAEAIEWLATELAGAELWADGADEE